jgi:hypothetical protein
MALSNCMKALYTLIASGTYPVSVGLRRAGDSTPMIVYEVSQVDIDCLMIGGDAGHYTISVTADCVADTSLLAWTVASDLVDVFSGVYVDNAENIKLVLSGVNATARTETPDDGQSDAERVVSVTLTILGKEI